jgi:hypothetical protein
VMQDLIFSRQQWDALISRLDEIRNKLAVLKPKEPVIEGCMEAHDVTRVYHISRRTLDRWRQTGRVPFHKVGNFVYFKVEDILGQIGPKDKRPVLSVSDGGCVSDKELRDRHRRMLLTRKFYKMPP